MLYTLAMVVVLASIAVFFSQEFVRALKKLFAIKGVFLFLPLLAGSWFVFTFDYLALWGVYYYREILQSALHDLVSIMPFTAYAEQVALIILLWCVSILPVIAIDQYIRRKSYKGYQYPNITSMILFIVSAILLLAL
jgi:flagellar biosynthesis protein FlhB